MKTIYKEDIGFTGTKAKLKSEIAKYKSEIDTWRNSVDVPKPIPNHPIYDELLDQDFTLSSRADEMVKKEKEDKKKRDDEEKKRIQKLKEAQRKQDELIKNKLNPKHKDYDYSYARQNADDGYLPLEEQLDKLFHDIDKGLISVKAKQSSFYIHRKEVKEQRYPKK